MVAAGSEKLLVMKTSVLPDSGSFSGCAAEVQTGAFLTGVASRPGDGLVANDAGRAIRRRRIDAMSIDVRLGTRDEASGPGLVQHIKAESQSRLAATIHDRRWLRLPEEHSRGHASAACHPRCHKTRNVAPQVEQRVHLHRRLGGAEVRPRKDRQAQSDGRRVQGVDGIGQVQPQFFVDVQRPRWVMSRWANAAWIRQSRLSLASASVERRTGWRKPM